LTSKKGIRHVIRGTVINCKGQPIKNAKIDQIHVVGGGTLKKTGLRTRSNGQFTLITPNNLTSRKIQFNYRPFLDSSTVSASSSVTLHVK
jgi:diphthamide synthase subunit DPH2